MFIYNKYVMIAIERHVWVNTTTTGVIITHDYLYILHVVICIIMTKNNKLKNKDKQ
jgi:hypothetical protein